jgi:beta-galactosidase GanA
MNTMSWLWGAALLLCAGVTCAVPMPHWVAREGHHALVVDGAPFTVLAGQLHNSSAWPDLVPSAFDQVKALHANTVQAPVYWEQFEPRPGKYDYSLVDLLVEQARAHDLRLVLLWFGTWKNGQMHYAPEWIKRDRNRYRRVIDAQGKALDVLSPYDPATLAADTRAFTALMTHLRQIDEGRYTVIMVQVENEAGSIGAARDHGARANALFRQPLPAALARRLGVDGRQGWAALGARGEELFTADAVAGYIDHVAAAGKRAYPLPMYVNAWMRYSPRSVPGVGFPSGGPTQDALEVWKLAAPSIDVIGVDSYAENYPDHVALVAAYRRPDNPLWIAESHFQARTTAYAFHALAGGGIGASVFGVDHNDDDEAHRATIAAHALNFALLQAMQPVLAQAAFEGRVLAAVEQSGQLQQTLSLGRWAATVSFGAPRWGKAPVPLPGNPLHDGRVLMLPLAPGEFLLGGFGARVELRPVGHAGEVLRVEQGHYDAQGRWVFERILNGDETDYGLNLRSDRVQLLRIHAETR